MTTTTKLIGTILTAAALVGFSGAGTAMAASSTERPTTDAAVVTTTSRTFEFKVTNFGDRDLVVSNVFATDGSGHKTRVGPFLPGDEYPAVGSAVEGHGSLTFKVSRTFLGNHGLSVVLYDPKTPGTRCRCGWSRARSGRAPMPRAPSGPCSATATTSSSIRRARPVGRHRL